MTNLKVSAMMSHFVVEQVRKQRLLVYYNNHMLLVSYFTLAFVIVNIY